MYHLGINHLKGRQTELFVHSRGNTAAVILHRYAVIRIQGDLDAFAVTCQGLVNGIIHDLVHQMVQSLDRGRSYIHSGALTNRLESFQNLNLAIAVFMVFFDVFHGFDSFRFLLFLSEGCKADLCSFPESRRGNAGKTKRKRRRIAGFVFY